MPLTEEQWKELQNQDPTTAPPKEEKGFLGTIADIGKGIVSGPVKEIENVTQAVHDTADFIDDKLGSGTVIDGKKDYDVVPDIIKPETALGETAQAISAFASGWVAGGKLISVGAKALKGATTLQKAATAVDKAPKYVNTILKGGVIDYLSGDASDQRLADTIVDNDLFGSSFAQFLASKEDDTAAEARLKNVVEGFLLGSAVDGALAVFKGMKKGAATAAKTTSIDKALSNKKATAEVVEAATKTAAPTTVEEVKKATGDAWATMPGTRTKQAMQEEGKNALRAKVKYFNDAHYSEKAVPIIENLQEALGRQIEEAASNKTVADTALKYIAENNLDTTFDRTKLLLNEGLSEAMDTRTATATRAIWLNAFAPDQLSKNLQLLKEGAEGAAEKTRNMVYDIFDVLVDLKASNLAAGQTGEINDIVRQMGKETASTAGMKGTNSAKTIPLSKEILKDKTDEEITTIATLMKQATENGDIKNLYRTVAAAAGKNNKEALKILGIPVEGAMDTVLKYRYIAMLSSLKTHMRNTIGNSAKIPLIAFEESVQGAALGWQAAGGTGVGKQLVGALAGAKDHGAYYLQGLKYARKQAWDTFKNSWKYGEALTRLSEYNTLKKTTEKSLGAFEWPLNALAAADDFFASLTGTAKAYETAMLDLKSKSILKGLDKKLAADVKTKWLEDSLDKAFVSRAMKDGTTVKNTLALTEMVKIADEATFQQELGKFGSAVARFTNSHPAMKMLFPFVKTPTNIFKDVFWTRGAGAPFELYTALTKGNPQQKAEAVAHLTSGIALWLTAYNLALDGKIIGQAPENKFQREAMQKNGVTFNSYRDSDGNYYSLDALEPYGSMLGFLATAVDKGQRGTGLSADVLFEALLATAKEKTYLKGLGDLMDTLDSDTPLDSKGVISGIGISFIPSILRDLGQSIDPIRRQTPDFYSKALDRTPYREELAPKVDWLTGQEEEYSHGGGAGAYFNAWSGSQDKGSAVFYELSRLDGVQPPTGKINGIDLSADEQAEYNRTIGTLEINGKTLYQTLDAVINSDSYQRDIEQNPDPTPYELAENRKEILQNIIKEYKKRAKAEFLKQNPQLKPDLTNWDNITNA